MTELALLREFHPTENYHQEYNDRTETIYCEYVIAPKLDALKRSSAIG
ncbi:MAG: hypothetical protein WED34_03670 [Planctomycetales bacterium]